jgi:hypothetical protein
MNIPIKIGEHCWNDVIDQNENECKVLITKPDAFTYILQCEAQDIELRFKSYNDLLFYCNSKFGFSVGSFCCE